MDDDARRVGSAWSFWSSFLARVGAKSAEKKLNREQDSSLAKTPWIPDHGSSAAAKARADRKAAGLRRVCFQ